MEFEIKRNVPIPRTLHGSHLRGGGKWQRLLEDMGNGDCVDIPMKSYNSIYVAAKRLEIAIKSRRKFDDLADGFVRVWRVSD